MIITVNLETSKKCFNTWLLTYTHKHDRCLNQGSTKYMEVLPTLHLCFTETFQYIPSSQPQIAYDVTFIITHCKHNAMHDTVICNSVHFFIWTKNWKGWIQPKTWQRHWKIKTLWIFHLLSYIHINDLLQFQP
jgi:hypothetical protein